MASYKVGQVIYLIHPQKLLVVPTQVVEQIIKRTVGGEETVYNLQPPDGSPTVTLSAFEGEVFENLGSVREYLLTNARQAIDTMIEKTEKTVAENFKTSQQAEKIVKRKKGRPKRAVALEPDSPMQVDLGNGQVGNLIDNSNIHKLVE